METKEQFRNRVKREGRWDEFVQYRKDFKEQGFDTKTAQQKAREKLASNEQARVQGISDNPNDRFSGDGNSLCRDVFASSKQVSARKVVQWVFNNIDIADVKPEDAPSSGAWSLLQRVKMYPDLLKEFYRSIWAKMLPTKSEIEAREKHDDDGRELVEFIDRIKRCGGRNE